MSMYNLEDVYNNNKITQNSNFSAKIITKTTKKNSPLYVD